MSSNPDGNVIHVEFQQPAAQQVAAAKQARNQWPKISKHSKKNGELVVTHPFLANDNELDKTVVRHLILDEPFCTPHGAQGQAWADTAARLNKEVNFATGACIFFPPITGPMLKTRFEAYMKFAKEIKADVPFNSGCDDEEEPGEVQHSIEEMHERYTSFMAAKDDDKKATMASKKGEKIAAEMIRHASLGMKPTEEELEVLPANMRGYDMKKKKVSLSGSGGSSGNSMRPSEATADSIASLQDQLVSRNQVSAMKEENKKRKFEIFQQKIDLENKRLEAEIDRENKRQEADKERREQESKNNDAMRTLLLAMASNFGQNISNMINK
jgi:hypothetical protein